MVISKSVPVLYGTAEWLPYLCGARSGRPHLYGARRYQPGSVWRALSDYRICTAHAAATRICMALRRYQPESGGCTGNAARICSARRRTTRICAAHAVMTPASMWCAPDPAKIDWICVVPAGAAPGSVGKAAAHADDYQEGCFWRTLWNQVRSAPHICAFQQLSISCTAVHVFIEYRLLLAPT